MEARNYPFKLAALEHNAPGGSRLENVVIIEVSSLVDQITLSLDLQSTDRYALMMARTTALAGDPKLAIAKVEAGLRRITGR
ncbi:hypothetical protein AWB76_02288 [Caballeronia temeraria]|uniref:Uncharacterized protein n=1 Tax=Caballeronia temeraria TaxID=1777137 RepID=A0A158AEX4_9BURK|nr:hypothetical protein [Caballeronia temeraria]SAK56422.1 hypothetical protein AWB76_02288 [Caballeronia temeraria]